MGLESRLGYVNATKSSKNLPIATVIVAGLLVAVYLMVLTSRNRRDSARVVNVDINQVRGAGDVRGEIAIVLVLTDSQW